MVRRDLKTFAKDPATRDHREPSRNLGACGKESARYYAKVLRCTTIGSLCRWTIPTTGSRARRRHPTGSTVDHSPGDQRYPVTRFKHALLGQPWPPQKITLAWLR